MIGSRADRETADQLVSALASEGVASIPVNKQEGFTLRFGAEKGGAAVGRAGYPLPQKS